MSKRKTPSPALPYWQTEPCPEWCWGHHMDTDAASDRKHRARWSGHVPLALHDPDVVERYADPAKLVVHVEQGYREVSPRVVVESEHVRPDLPVMHLTPGEAAKLGQALLKAARIGGETR